MRLLSEFSKKELELSPSDLGEMKFNGIYDHIYDDNVFENSEFGTHYIVCAIECELLETKHISLDNQHEYYSFFKDKDILESPDVHENVKNYLKNNPKNQLILNEKVKLLIGRIITVLFFSQKPDNKTLNEAERLEIIKGLEPLSQTENLADAELDWNKKVNGLISQLKHKQIKRFLSWDVIRKTMFIEYEPYIRNELDYLKNNPSLLLEESSFGTPTRLYYYYKSSANLIHHNYHVARILNHFGIQINDLNQVLEFGGGYGSMARVFYKLGFTGKYAIYDFPAFNSSRRYI